MDWQVNVINTADTIYRGETFDGCDTGYGFEVRKVCTHILSS